MYAVEVRDDFPLTRDALIEGLASAGIESRTFFCPLNMQPFLQRMPGFRAVGCPVAERLWQTGLYLPCAITLEDDQIAHVVERIRELAAA
jgi:perosamine synthetase